MDVGAQVTRFRERRGWSQIQLAEKANVSRSHLNHVERGLANPTTVFLGKIEKALGIQQGTLTSTGDVVHVDDALHLLPDDVREYVLSKEGQSIIKMLADAQIDAETIELLIKALRTARNVETSRNV